MAVPWSAATIADRRNKAADKMIDHPDETIGLEPMSPKAYRDRGNAWLEKREYDKAIVDATEAIRLDPKDAYAYIVRGCAWSGKREHDRAITDFDEAIRLDPNYGKAYFNRGDAWCVKQEYDKAITDLTEAIRLDPNDTGAYRVRGHAWSESVSVNGTRGLGHAPRKRAANHSPRSNSASWQSRSRASNFGLPHIFPVGRFDRVGPGGRCEEYRPAADPRASFDSSPPSPCSVTRPRSSNSTGGFPASSSSWDRPRGSLLI